MQSKLSHEAEQYAAQNRRRGILKKIVCLLACVVVFCTTYAMILPAITMERYQCGMEEHTHTAQCYEKVSSVPVSVPGCTYESLGVHIHNAACYDSEGELVCGQADFLIHYHDDRCRDGEGTLLCGLPEIGEHVHTEACYETPDPEETEAVHSHEESCYAQERGELLCLEEEKEGHLHADTCYQTNLLCDLTENEGHTHADGCYEAVLVCEVPEEAGHIHGDTCYETRTVLVCQPEEGSTPEAAEPRLICTRKVVALHIHDDAACYEDDGSGKRVICGNLEVRQHIHDESCFRAEETEPADPLTCTLTEDHTHSELCYGTWKLICGCEAHVHEDSCKPGELEEKTAVAEETTIPEEPISLMALRPEREIGGGTFLSAEGNELTWRVIYNSQTDEYTLAIDGEGAMPDFSSVNNTPWYLDFYYPYYTLSFGQGITRIGANSFYMMNIWKIDDWGGVTSVGQYAFYRCGFLWAKAIGNGTMMSSLKLPDQMESIEKLGLYFEQGFKELELNEGLKTLGNSAITVGAGCQIHIPSTVTEMNGLSFSAPSEGAAYSVAEGGNYCVVDGVLYSKDLTVLVDLLPYTKIQEFTVPDTVTEIALGALPNLKYVKKITIPSSVKIYPQEMFSGCSLLEEVYFEDGTAPYNFGRMFFSVNNISRIRLPENTAFKLQGAMLSGYSKGYANLEELKIPNGVTQLSGLWTYDYGVMKALREIIYDAADADISDVNILGEANYFNTTIGAHVNRLEKHFSFYMAPHSLSFRFEPSNRFTVDKGGFAGAPRPFTDLYGLFYVDAQGLVYLCDEESGEAALIYCPPGIETATIPAVIDPDDETYGDEKKIGRTFAVTTVRKDALKWAEDLQSLNFADLAAMKALDTLALANCASLTSVQGETTVEAVLELFAHMELGYNVLHNTGLIGASGTGSFDAAMDGEEKVVVEDENTTKLEITAAGEGLVWVRNEDGTGGYRTLTGRTVTIEAAVGNTQANQTKLYRVYFQTTGEDADIYVNPGTDGNFNGWYASYHATEDPYTVYIQFAPPPEGNTNGLPVICSYPNIVSGGGGLTVWGVTISPEEPEGTILTSEKTMQISWTTQADDFAVSKTAESTNTVGVISPELGIVKPTANLVWKINLNRDTENTSPYGKDHATGVEFKDVFTLPEGVHWRAEVAEAIANGTIKASGQNLYAGDIMVATIQDTAGSMSYFIRSRALRLEDGQYVFRWGVSSSQTTAELASIALSMTIYADALRIGTDESSGYDSSAVSTFTNEVYATVHYTYRKDAEYSVDAETGQIQNSQLYASATRNISGGAAALKSKHTATPTTNYFGENAQYTIEIYNEGALPWRSTVVREDAGHTLEERLADEQYISPEDMVRMFRMYPNMTITIQNARLCTQGATVAGAYPGTEVSLTLANTERFFANSISTTLTISACEGGYSVCVADGETHSGSDLAGILQELGYAVTDSDLYTCIWPLTEPGEEFVLQGGEHRYFDVFVTVKNTFQIIYTDWPVQYNSGGKVTVSARMDVRTPEGKSIDHRSASLTSVRETSIIKEVTRYGDSLPSSYAVNQGDVLDYKLTLSHYGSGNLENLPMVDDIYGSQYLLVPQLRNPGLSGLETYGDCYILTEGTYENVYVGVDDEGNDLLAASVVVEMVSEEASFELDGEMYTFSGMHTQIRWYFPEIASGSYQMTVSYQTLVDLDLTGITYTIGNVVRLNDREAHHLYDTIWGGGSRFEFDKNIVVTRGADPSRDALDNDDYSEIAQGESVTYRLELKNPRDVSVELNGSRLADALPLNLPDAIWQKDVNIVDFCVVADETVIHEGLDEWFVGDSYGGLVGTRQYILWPETTNITFTEPGSIYLYFTLVYPDNTEENNLWDTYSDLVSGGKIYNDFYLYRENAGVAHQLKENGRVLLQKGVYGTYHYDNSNYMTTSNSRANFNNQDSRKRAVAYYVVLYNATNKRLYLNELYDQLPQGFTFLKFIGPDGNVDSTSNYQYVVLNGGRNYLTDLDVEEVSYRSARIHADTSDGLKFVVSAGTGANAVRYDPEFGQYYLEKGEAIEFGYLCDVGYASETGNIATNTISMPYTDYLNTGVSVVPKENAYVTAAESVFFNNSNDGRRIVKNSPQISENSGAVGEDIWLVSDVTVYRGSIVPGVTKYVDSYQMSLTGPAQPYVNHVTHNAFVNWRVRLHNAGTLSMTDYTFQDVLQYPYSFAGDIKYTKYGLDSYREEEVSLLSIPVHTPVEGTKLTLRDHISNTDRTLVINGEEVACGWGNKAFRVSLRVDENGNEVLSIVFSSLHMSIIEGGYMDITLSSVNATGNYTYSVYTNQASLQPTQEFTTVGQGSVVRDEEGNMVGAQNAASVTVSNGFTTSSGKEVAEVGNPENASGEKNYIVLSETDKLFTYKLIVRNDTKKAMTKLVVLDNLPEVGDHNPFNTNIGRNSEFTVSLAENPDISVQIIPAEGEAYAPADYLVQYSTGTNFGRPYSKHWTGETPDAGDATIWTTDPTGARSIRVIIQELIPDEATVVVTFNAKISGEASPGETAWNNFGYHYELQDLSTMLEAMSPVAGVRVPDVPSLLKRLVDSNGSAISTNEDAQFRFLVYEGDVMEGNFETEESLHTALTDAGRAFREFTVEVEAGKTSSERIKLSADTWKWQAGATYTIVELPVDREYSFRRFIGTAADYYTFTHTPEISPDIVCENSLNLWTIRLKKVNPEGENLAGAVFALYSPERTEQLVGNVPGIPGEIVNAGQTLYLAQTATSDTEGQIEWNNLLASYYYLLEVQAPEGYNLPEMNGQILYRSSSAGNIAELTVVNEAGYELPETGGPGTRLYTKLALMWMGTGTILLCLQQEKRKRVSAQG